MAVATPAVSAESSCWTGRIFNVQRCSVHDGPGIRTTVFLKGCPLSCTWCHNPEGIEEAPDLMINADRCLACGACSEACPVERGGAVPAGEAWERDACTRCGSCVDVCPADARELAGRDIEVGELVDILERDRVFFDASGGGVTFSGGEPLAQPEFLVRCLEECRRRGLRTAVDTCGLAPRRTLLEVAKLADLILFDLKHMDPTRHHAETGADNRLILDNLRALSGSQAEIWIRIPLIPGFNESRENTERTAEFLKGLPKRHRVFVLPYHGTADGKRNRLDDERFSSDFHTPSGELLHRVATELETHGLEVTVGGSP